MRVLLLNQFFWPDSSATSQLLTDVAWELARLGHQVTVISAEQGGYAVEAERTAMPPVTMQRVTTLPFARGKLGRVLSYLSFYVRAAWKALLLPRQDVVLTLTTPPLLALLGTLLRAVRGSRHVIWEMDMYPDVAVDLGYFRKAGLLDQTVGYLADLSRRQADTVIALGSCMQGRLRGRGISQQKIAVVDNWADGSAIQPQPRVGDPNKLVVLYSGNLGLAHDLETVTEAIALLKGDDRFRFRFVGSGGRRPELAAFLQEHAIDSVDLLPYVQRESLGESLSTGDIGLVTQREACCGSVVPSKVYGLLAAGRPVLFVGPAAATPARIVERFGCGWHVRNGSGEALAALLRHLAAHHEEVKQAGQRARTALLEHFDRPLGVARIVRLLEASTSGPQRQSTTAADRPQTVSTVADSLGATR